MRTAKTDLLQILNGLDEVECASLVLTDEDDVSHKVILRCGWDKEEWEEFMSSLDFDFDEYSIQGTVWLCDDTWVTREFWYVEYEAREREFWAHIKPPQIPAECL